MLFFLGLSDPILLRGLKGPDSAPEHKILKFTSKYLLFHRRDPVIRGIKESPTDL